MQGFEAEDENMRRFLHLTHPSSIFSRTVEFCPKSPDLLEGLVLVLFPFRRMAIEHRQWEGLLAGVQRDAGEVLSCFISACHLWSLEVTLLPNTEVLATRISRWHAEPEHIQNI